jgi:predicted kinase
MYVFCHTFAILSYMKSLHLSKPHIIVMVGIPGAGKSFFAEHFAQTFGAPYIHYGAIRAELFNDPTYSHDENEIISRIGTMQLHELLKTERTIVFDGASDARTDRTEIAKLAHAAGYQPLFVWVQTESVAAKSRATKPSKTTSYVSSDQFDQMLRRFTAPNAAEKAVVISGKHTYASQLKIVLKRLVGPRIESVEQHVNAPRVTPGRHIAIR